MQNGPSMTPTRCSLSAGMTIAAIFVGQSLGMTGIVSFPALLPEFRQLWSLSGSEAGLISGIYFVGYIVAVPVLSALTDRLDPRRIYALSLLCGAVTAFGFAALGDGAASAALWRFLQGAAFGGAHMPGMRALCDPRFRPSGRPGRSRSILRASRSGSACPTPFRESWPGRLVGASGLPCSPPAHSPQRRSPG